MDTGIGRVRGIISLVKQRNGQLEISELAEESDEDIDDLLPLIEACKLLGFVTVKNSKLKITEKGSKLTFSNFSKSIRDGLKNAEPFKSSLKVLDDSEVSTRDLFTVLKQKGIMLHTDEATNDLMMKKLLIRWGVRSKLMAYDSENDVWKKGAD